MTTEAFAPAKVNLTLHITGQRADGYHLLDSLVVFAQVGDLLHFQPGRYLRLTVDGPFAAGVPVDGRNLVWKAAQMAGWKGHIHLTKNLPHGGGIGGGSSDAAAVLRAFDGGQDALSLGADVPVCLHPRATRMRGIGEDVTPLVEDLTFFAVLVNPGLHVPTPDVFRALEKKTNPAMTALPPDGSALRVWIEWLGRQRNDLEAAAIAVEPAIETVLAALRGTQDVMLARMSGSGSTCFGLYPTPKAARDAAASLAADHPDWWCRETILS